MQGFESSHLLLPAFWPQLRAKPLSLPFSKLLPLRCCLVGLYHHLSNSKVGKSPLRPGSLLTAPFWTLVFLPRVSNCRLLDHSNEGFTNWEFMTVHCWGEKAEGEWTLEIQDMPSQVRNPEKQGQWLSGISHTTLYLNPFVYSRHLFDCSVSDNSFFFNCFQWRYNSPLILFKYVTKWLSVHSQCCATIPTYPISELCHHSH